MNAMHGPFHRLGEPGGPGCPVGVLPISTVDIGGNEIIGSLLDGGGDVTEIELLRTVASRLGVRWGHDGFGWWAVVTGFQFPTWAVWRQDDHGNTFLVEANLREHDAEMLAAQLEARGHKQTYWYRNEIATDAGPSDVASTSES